MAASKGLKSAQNKEVRSKRAGEVTSNRKPAESVQVGTQPNKPKLTPKQAAAAAMGGPVKERNVRPRHKTTASKVPPKPPATKKASKSKPVPIPTTQEKPKPVRGRPTTYRDDIADAIFNRLSEGETLRQICRDEDMPAWRTVYDWKDSNAAFSARFARARVAGFDAIAEDTIEMLDTNPERTATEFGDKVDPGFVQWQKNRVEQRMKLLAKWSPKYSDKVDVNHGGQEGNPVQVSTKVVVVPAKNTVTVETKPIKTDERNG